MYLHVASTELCGVKYMDFCFFLVVKISLQPSLYRIGLLARYKTPIRLVSSLLEAFRSPMPEFIVEFDYCMNLIPKISGSANASPPGRSRDKPKPTLTEMLAKQTRSPLICFEGFARPLRVSSCCLGSCATWISPNPCFSTNYKTTQPCRSLPTLRLLSITSNVM